MTDRFPLITKQIVDSLDQLFPEHSADKGATHADLMFNGGQRNVVRFLKRVYAEQTETPGEIAKVLQPHVLRQPS